MDGIKVVPTSAQDVTEAWLEKVLEKANPGVKARVLSLARLDNSSEMGVFFKASVKLASDNAGDKNDDATKMVIKIGPGRDSHMWEFFEKSNVDIREVKAYHDDLPALVAFEKDRLGKSELVPSLPKIYASDYDDSKENRGIYIVMEDLSVSHKLINYLKGELIGKDLLITALHAIARFHAVSYCYSKSQGKPFGLEKRATNPLQVDGKNQEDYEEFRIKAIANAGKDGKTKHLVPYIDHIFKDYKSFFIKTMTLVDDTFLIHGDFWCNNIMFDKDDSQSVKIFDWATICSGPPCFDFVNLAFLSLPPEETEDAWDNFVQAYFNKLESTFKEFNVEMPFTKNQFIKDCNRIGYITVFLTVFNPIYSEPEWYPRRIWLLENSIKHRPDLFFF